MPLPLAAAAGAGAAGAAERHLTAQPDEEPGAEQPARWKTRWRSCASSREQKQPPKARYNPQAGGAVNGGGNPLGNDTAALTADQRGAIGDHVRECWSTDPGVLDLDKMQVLLTVTTDGNGIARQAVVAPEDARAASPRTCGCGCSPNGRCGRCWTRSAPTCRCHRTMLGKTNVLTFRFSP